MSLNFPRGHGLQGTRGGPPVAEHDDRPVATSVRVADLGPVNCSMRHKPEATAPARRPEVPDQQARQPAGAHRPCSMPVILTAAIAAEEIPPRRQNAPVPHKAGRMESPGGVQDNVICVALAIMLHEL